MCGNTFNGKRYVLARHVTIPLNQILNKRFSVNTNYWPFPHLLLGYVIIKQVLLSKLKVKL